MKIVLSLLLLLLFFEMPLQAQQPAAKIPEFSFLKYDKTAFTNKNLPTSKLIFFIFFDTDCDHCRYAISYINSHLKGFQNTAMYVISLDGPEKVKAFLKLYGNKIPDTKNITLLQDTLQEFINKFKPRKYPSLFLYSQKKELLLYDDDEQHLPLFLEKIKNAGK